MLYVPPSRRASPLQLPGECRLAAACIIDLDDEPVKAVQHWVADEGARAIRLFLRNTDPAKYDPATAGYLGFGDVTGSKQSAQKTFLQDAVEHQALERHQRDVTESAQQELAQLRGVGDLE